MKALLVIAIVLIVSVVALYPRSKACVPSDSVGDIYRVTEELCVVGDTLLDGRNREDINGWRTYAEEKGELFEDVPVGSLVELTSLEIRSQSSWNTGTYSYPVARAKVTSGVTGRITMCEVQALFYRYKDQHFFGWQPRFTVLEKVKGVRGQNW